ncbi:hypothetical protein AC249_AIPGENE7670 [Exaiptasia diaphana]|nr:hypothetical protein AC249_AIPGENE7670 [Exaiptasia diaphana]
MVFALDQIRDQMSVKYLLLTVSVKTDCPNDESIPWRPEIDIGPPIVHVATGFTEMGMVPVAVATIELVSPGARRK